MVVATSNVEPDRLYQDGLNRALFLPFIDLLKEHMDVVRLDARTDYRLEKLSAAVDLRRRADCPDDARRSMPHSAGSPGNPAASPAPCR